MQLSLRMRIFLWYALVISVIILGLSFTTQKVSIEGLRTAIDQRLQERSGVVANAIVLNPRMRARGYENLVQRITEQQLPYVPAVLRISDPRRNILASFGDVPETLLAVMDYQLSLSEIDEGQFETIQIMGTMLFACILCQCATRQQKKPLPLYKLATASPL